MIVLQVAEYYGDLYYPCWRLMEYRFRAGDFVAYSNGMLYFYYTFYVANLFSDL